MAAKQTTEEDDDEGFGDFKFVVSSPSAYPNPTLQLPQIKGSNLFAISNDNNEDDDWGDFMDSSSPMTAKSDLSGGFYTPGSHPSTLSKPIDPFDFFSNNSPMNMNRGDLSEINRVDSYKKQWVKPQGALDLSIFGEVEEEHDREEGSGASESHDLNRTDLKENGSSLYLGLGNNHHVSKLNDQQERINVHNDLNSTSNGFHANLSIGNGVEELKPENEFSFSSNGLDFNSNFISTASNLNRLNDSSRLFHQFEQVLGKNESISEPNELNSNERDSYSNEDFDDDDGWEYLGAASENNHGHLHTEVGEKVETENTSVFGNSDLGPQDLFAVSSGFSLKSTELDIGFDFKPSKSAQNGVMTESHTRNGKNEDIFGDFNNVNTQNESKHETWLMSEVDFRSGTQSVSNQNEAEGDLFPPPVDGKIDTDDDLFGEFRDENSEFESINKNEAKAADFSDNGFHASQQDGQVQTNTPRSKNKQGALPISLFSEDNIDDDNSFNFEDSFTYKPTSNSRNGIGNHGPSVSFDDLILNLYSQSELSVNLSQKPTMHELEPVPMVSNSNIVNNSDDDDADEDIDDDLWEFKDAIADANSKDQSQGPIDVNTSVTKLNIETYTEFYTKLKNELCHIAYFHLDSMKRTKTSAALSGDDFKVEALDNEIQEAYKELNLENTLVYPENHHSRTACLNDFLGILQGSKFQMLESEYHLSKKLLLAENELKTTMEVLGHTRIMLKILTLKSVEEQSYYITAWSRIISICSQELEHGASIWKQALQKNLQWQILAERRGKEFMVALGEIYRVVQVIGASAEFYKMWILSNLPDPASLKARVLECSTLWSSSGLEEALHSISDPVDFEYDGTIKDLVESINHIHDLDKCPIKANLLGTQEPMCRLSLLTTAILPGMKLVVWNEDQYFLKLTNFWANLISSNPPKLPHIYIG